MWNSCGFCCYCDSTVVFDFHAQRDEGFCIIKGKEWLKVVQAEGMEEERGGRRKGA